MAEERQIRFQTDPRTINLLSSLMPTLEGLYLMTVADGRKGIAVLRFHQSQRTEVERFLGWVADRHGLTLLEE